MEYLQELATFVSDWLERVSAEPGFWSGVAIGIIGFAVTAFVVFMVKMWYGKVTTPFKPQTVTHTTSKTPAQVSCSGCVTLGVGIAVIVLVVFVVVAISFPEILEALGLQI